MFTVTSLGSWGAASAFWRHKRPTKPHHPVQCHLEAVEKSQRDCCYEQALSEPWWPTAWGPKGNRWSLLSWGCCLGTAIGCARGENLSNVSSKRHARKKTTWYNLKNIPSRHSIFRFESGRPWWHIHWTTLLGLLQELPSLAPAWEKSFAYGLQSRLPSPKELRYFLCVDPLLYPLPSV